MSKIDKKDLSHAIFFVTCKPECKLNLVDRIVWSWLLKARHHNKKANLSELSQITGLHRDTIYKALHRLYDGIDIDLFSRRDAENWYDSFNYSVVEFEEGLSPLQSVLMGILRSRQATHKLWGLSYSYLADAVGCERRAVKRALKELKEVTLIPVTKSKYHRMDSFDIILAAPQPKQEPTIKSIEPPKTTEDKKMKIIESLVSDKKPSITDLFPNWHSMTDAEKEATYMASKGFSKQEISRIQELTKQKRQTNELFELFRYVKDLVKEHRLGKKPGSGAKLVIYKLEVDLGIRQKTESTPAPKPKVNPVEAEQRKALKETDHAYDCEETEMERWGIVQPIRKRIVNNLMRGTISRADYHEATRSFGEELITSLTKLAQAV